MEIKDKALLKELHKEYSKGYQEADFPKKGGSESHD